MNSARGACEKIRMDKIYSNSLLLIALLVAASACNVNYSGIYQSKEEARNACFKWREEAGRAKTDEVTYTLPNPAKPDQPIKKTYTIERLMPKRIDLECQIDQEARQYLGYDTFVDEVKERFSYE